MRLYVCVATTVIAAGAAGATPITATDLARAPRPEQAARIVVARRVAEPPLWERAVYALPRAAASAALAPARLALWTEDRYRVTDRARDVFWNDARTIGLYPVASWEGGGSLRGGAAFVHRDLLGMHLDVRGTAGINERVAASARLGSGTLLGKVTVEGTASYRDVRVATFYGYGADDLSESAGMPLDATHDAGAIASRYAHRDAGVRLRARWQLADRVSLHAGGSRRRVELANGTADDYPAIADAYAIDTVPGFATGVDAVRGELALHIDRRATRHRFQSAAVPSTGVATHVYGGWQRGVGADRARFAYGGVDVIHHIDLFGGDRVLALRLATDAVLAGREDVAFVDLPTLGGAALLRGYTSGRFRDTWAVAGSAEYTYPVTDGLAGFVFVDAGRVAPHAAALVDEVPRVSLGFGLQAQRRTSMIARAWIAGTEEGLLANVVLEPAFAARGREVR